MKNARSTIMFYVNFGLISLVNMILIYALFSHFVLQRPQEQITWLLGVFATEILACFVLGWRKVVNAEGRSENDREEPDKSNGEVVNSGNKTLFIDRLKVSEKGEDLFLTIKEKGLGFLKLARNIKLSPETRIKYAKQAIKEFARIPKDSLVYISALYDIATAHRILHNFSKAIAYYEKADELLSVKGKEFFTERELINWKAAISMMIGNVYFEQNLPGKARFYYLSAWKIKPDYFTAVLNLFEVSVKLNNLVEAEIWKELLQMFDEYSLVSELVETKMNLLYGCAIREDKDLTAQAMPSSGKHTFDRKPDVPN